MNCLCGGKTAVLDTKAHGNGVWRRRVCSSCRQQFTTDEVVCSTVKYPNAGPKNKPATRAAPETARKVASPYRKKKETPAGDSSWSRMQAIRDRKELEEM